MTKVADPEMETIRPMRHDLPHLTTPLPGPRAQEVIARDRRSVSPSYTRCYPLVARRGEGAMVEDVDGNRFLDFNAGIAVVATGHCHPRVVEAIRKQAGRADPHVGHRFLLRSPGGRWPRNSARSRPAASSGAFRSATPARKPWKAP